MNGLYEGTEVTILFFTLQDAIDFSTYAVRTTIEHSVSSSEVRTVGGPIDVLAIFPSGSGGSTERLG